MKKTIISTVMLVSIFITPVTSIFAETNNQQTITTKTEDKKLTPLADNTKVNYTITVNLVDKKGNIIASKPIKANDSIEKLYRVRSKSIYNTYEGYLGKEFKEGQLRFKALEISQEIKRTQKNNVYDYVDVITVKVESVTGETKPSADKKEDVKPSTDKKDETKPTTEQERKVFVVEGDTKTYYVNKEDIPSTVKPEQIKEITEKEAKESGRVEFVKDKRTESPKQSDDKKVTTTEQKQPERSELPKTGDAGLLLSTAIGTMLTGFGAFLGFKHKK